MVNVAYASHDVIIEPAAWQVQVAGEVFKPEPKVFELLHYLVRNPGRVVSKPELLDSLWAGEVVGESVLTRCVSCARKLLADSSRTPKFIRTAHGRGYEFIAPVSERSMPSAAQTAAAASEHPPPVVSPSGGQRAFVGRVAEGAALRTALQEIASSRKKLVLVTGEPGIGKTRLLEEITARMPGTAELHWARASSSEGAPPFFVWQQCFRSIVRQRSLKTVLRAFNDASSGTRKLLFGAERWHESDTVGWDSPSARFRAFDEITAGLTELGRHRPLVLVFDDLHAADLASLLLLESVIHGVAAPLLILGTLRDAQPSADASRQAALARIRNVCQPEIALSGLTRDQVREFIGERGEDGGDTLAQRLFARTGGNPLFLSMLLAHDLDTAARSHLPTAVKQAVAERLAPISAECTQMLGVAAVHGGEFDGSLLARSCSLPIATCNGLLETARDAHLVTVADSTRYRFVHDLVREVLYAQLDADERSRAHFAVGRTLQTMAEYQEPRHAATLAGHFVQSVDHGGASPALDLSIQAGAYALRNLAYEEAVRHFLVARDLLPSCADVDPATECAVLLDLGLAEVSAGQRESGQETLHLAAAKARELGANEELASVALSLAPGLFSIETGVYDPALVTLLREALEHVGQTNDRLRALLLARLALALYWSDTFEERVRLCDEAKNLADRLDLDEIKAAVTTARVFALLRPSNLRERQELSEVAIELSRRAGDRQSLMINLLHRGAMLLEAGDLAGASFEADAFRALAEEIKQPQALWIVRAQQACRLLLQGRLEDVERLAGECLMAGERVRDHNALLTFGVHLTVVRIEQGRAEEVLDVVRDYATRYPLIVGWRVLYTYALLRANHHQEATAEYQSLKARNFALPDDLIWMIAMGWLAELAHAENDAESAALLYERFVPYADRLIVVGYAGIMCLGSVQRALGLLCATFGDALAASRHFEEALRVNRRLGAVLPLAYTLRDYGDSLRSEIGGKAEAAEVHLDEARKLAQDRNLSALLAALS